MIRLALIGNVDLTRDGRAEMDAPLRRSKRVALLAYLAVARPRGFHRRDKVAAVFWPELPADRARAALRTTLSRLRDDHDADLILGRGADEIAVDTSLLTCDVLEFDAALDASRFEDAVALFRGPFMDGVHVEGAGEELENWIAADRSRLRDGFLRALGALAAAAEQRGDLAAAIAAARRASDAAPADEPIARRLIGLLAAAGNRGGAMQAYADLVQRLRDEFDIDPAAETSALVAALRMPAVVPGSTPAGTAAPAGDVRAALLEGVPRTVATPRNRTARYLTGAIVAAILLTGAGLVQARLRGAPPPELAAAWRPVTPVGSAPAGYYGSRAVLDSTGNALLVFGGVADLARHALVPLGEEYWRLRGLGAGDGAAWTRITPAAGPHPAARWLFGVSSDAAHDRVIVHGGALGFTSPCANDTWVLDHASAVGHAAAWRRVVVRGPAPPARADFDQVFDARRLRLIVFAGHDCFYPSYEDTWVLSFDDSSLSSGTWRALAPDSSAGLPVRRDSYTAAYDTNTERLFIFGGRASTVPTGEIWELEHAGGAGGVPAWHPVRCGGEAPVITSPASTMDPASDTWTVFGGIDANRQPTRSVWRLTGVLRDVAHCRWERLASADPSPAARYGASAAVLPRSGEMVIFGGEFVNTPLSDAWVLRAANPMAAGTTLLVR